jgi:hypothetical protein
VSSTGQTINLKFEVPKLVLLERSLKLLISVTEVQILLHASKQWQIKDPLIQERALLSSFLLAHFFCLGGFHGIHGGRGARAPAPQLHRWLRRCLQTHMALVISPKSSNTHREDQHISHANVSRMNICLLGIWAYPTNIQLKLKIQVIISLLLDALYRTWRIC